MNALEALRNKKTRHLYIGKEIVVLESNPRYYEWKGDKWYLAATEGNLFGIVKKQLESYKGFDIDDSDMLLTITQYSSHKDNDRFLGNFKIVKNSA